MTIDGRRCIVARAETLDVLAILVRLFSIGEITQKEEPPRRLDRLEGAGVHLVRDPVAQMMRGQAVAIGEKADTVFGRSGSWRVHRERHPLVVNDSR